MINKQYELQYLPLFYDDLRQRKGDVAYAQTQDLCVRMVLLILLRTIRYLRKEIVTVQML